MEDLMQLYEFTERAPSNLEQLTEEWLDKLRVILWGQTPASTGNKDTVKALPAASPEQKKKRVERLSLLSEEDAKEPVVPQNADNGKLSKGGNISPRKSKRLNAEQLSTAESMKRSGKATDEDVVPRNESLEEESEPTTERKSEATNLMPPPSAPAATAPIEDFHTGRPQRAAKLKSEKCLREPRINAKMRRHAAEDVGVKLEHEQRPSQMHDKHVEAAAATAQSSSKASISSAKSNDSIGSLPGKRPSPVEINRNSDEGVVVQPTTVPVPQKKVSVWKVYKEDDKPQEISESGVRDMCIIIKREKVSVQAQVQRQDPSPSNDATFTSPEAVRPTVATTKSKNSTFEETSMTSSILSSTTNASTVVGKKIRKKKDAPPHRPIKVERFSALDPKPSPVASRTRHGSSGKVVSQHLNEEDTVQPEQPIAEEGKRPGSVYEDALETPPSRNSKATVVNETVNLGSGPAADATINLGPVSLNTKLAQTSFQVVQGQTTFVLDADNSNAIVPLIKSTGAQGDATFDIHSASKNEKEDDGGGHRSFETAKDSSVAHDDSLITDDESCGPSPSPPPPVSVKHTTSLAKHTPAKASASSKAISSAQSSYKMPTRNKELFNPLAQSPVKMRVEAFENAASAAAIEQPKRPLRNKKENVTPTSVTTPVIGKPVAPSLGRFLTPTQSLNAPSVGSAYTKKVPTSASKAVPLTKSGSSHLQRSNSISSGKTLHRENSADDFRKGLHNLAEERKKQREQKHLLAAQQREAKERERVERLAKLAKEREEKRMQKQQELLEQKKREMEEIQRKLRLQQEEEAASIKAGKEREQLMQLKQQRQMAARQRMMPPPPKSSSKYTFEMLHEDDSTDDEDKVSYKRPPPPSWSRSHKRGQNVLKQEFIPSCYIDSFFSVQPMTPDLKQIFPNIDARHLKRNSSVLWSTPPRYSELPKY